MVSKLLEQSEARHAGLFYECSYGIKNIGEWYF